MSALLERIPTLSHEVRTEGAGPAGTRPFGLDALTTPVRVDGRRPIVTVDPGTQLSAIDGQMCTEDPSEDEGTACNTESDGRDAIAIDTDTNDD
ncbi:hypothetical protein ACFRI7_14050 [Streptomyces sp. NPDC056716]|uniref:hypothetical protein n=1 Tax=unclassified Streptomyces TaxID=2593676 RepID=UPI0036BEB93C